MGQVALLALSGGLFAWFVTALGGGLVFFFKEFNARLMNASLGFAAGVMVAASVWSLIMPALDYSSADLPRIWSMLLVLSGFFCGGWLLFGLDKLIPHIHLYASVPEGRKSTWRRSILLVSAVTLHNIPEGMAVGVAFGAYGLTVINGNPDPVLLNGAIALTLGIAIQDFPEGAAISLPLRREGFSRGRSFFYGQLSGVVEPIAAVLAAILVLYVQPILPFVMAMAAGAMIFLVFEELIPEAQQSPTENDWSTGAAMLGFGIMMSLDVLLAA